MRSLFAVVATIACAACDLSFVAVATDTPAQLSMIIHASERTFDVEMSAQLSPGVDADGRIREVASDLVVLGDVIPPARNGALVQYSSTWSYVSLGADDHIAVALPAITDITSESHSLSLPYLVRRDEHVLRPTPGSDVILHPDYAEADAENPLQWRLSAVDTAGNARIQLFNTGSVPDEIVLPAQLLGPEPQSIIRVAVEVTETHRIDVVPERYVANVLVRSELEWVLSWE